MNADFSMADLSGVDLSQRGWPSTAVGPVVNTMFFETPFASLVLYSNGVVLATLSGHEAM